MWKGIFYNPPLGLFLIVVRGWEESPTAKPSNNFIPRSNLRFRCNYCFARIMCMLHLSKFWMCIHTSTCYTHYLAKLPTSIIFILFISILIFPHDYQILVIPYALLFTWITLVEKKKSTFFSLSLKKKTTTTGVYLVSDHKEQW